MRLALFALLLGAGVSPVVTGTLAAVPTPAADPGAVVPGAVVPGGVVPGRLVVQLTPAAARRVAQDGPGVTLRSGLAGFDALHARVRATRIHQPFVSAARHDLATRVGLDRFCIIELDPSVDLRTAAALYAADASVESVSLDPIATPDAVPNDPSFPSNWGHDNTGQLTQYVPATGLHNGPPVGTLGFDSNLPTAWDGSQGFGDPSILIAMIDNNGVDVQHADLRIVAGWDFWDNDPNPDDPCLSPGIGCGHGTSCAGVAAAIANNLLQDAGAAGGCSILPFRINGASQVAAALIAAADSGAHVANMSFTFYGVNSHPALEAAMTYADAGGVLLFSSCGNRNDNSGVWLPQSAAECISIGAASPCGTRKRSSSIPSELRPDVLPDPAGVSCDNEVFWGSSYGGVIQDAPDAVDLLAPVILPAAAVGGGLDAFFSGTSCSNAYAVGVAALIRARYPSWSNAQVRQRMFDTAIDIVGGEAAAGWDRYTGYGMIDAGAALASPAQPDLRPEVASGWYDSIVPSPAAGADTANVPAPALLPGDVTNYLNVAHANAGSGPAAQSYAVSLSVDGVEVFADTAAAAPAGAVRYNVDIPRTVPGGRHTIGLRVDATDANAEADESNNATARQWIFEPVTIPGDVALIRPGPPDPEGGWAEVAGMPSLNQDAVRFQSMPFGALRAIAAHAENPAENYDVRVFAPSAGPLDGFEDGTELAASLRPAGLLDVLVANEHTLGAFTLDAGFADAGSGGTSPNRIEIRNAMPISVPEGAIAIAWAEHEMLTIGEALTSGGRQTFDLVTNDPAQPLRLAVFPPSVTVASISDALFTASTEDPGFGDARTVLDVELAAGDYPWIVWRDPVDGTDPAAGTLRIRPTPANLVAHTDPGAFGPIVPSPPDTSFSCEGRPAPATLPGDAMTRFDYLWRNDGPVASLPMTTHVELDGVAIPFADGSAPPAGAFCRLDSVVVRGGRHTLGLRVDVADDNDELFLADNVWAAQWVWAPATIPPETPVGRAAPPPIDGGHALVANPHTNADGLRTPDLAPSANDGFLAVAAVVPEPGSDVTLVLHPPSANPQDGFRDDAILATSEMAGALTDFVVVDVDTTTGGAPGPRDLGIRRVGGDTGYTAEVASSRALALAPGAAAIPDSLEAGHVVRLYEASAGPIGGALILQLRALGGDANLGLALVRRDGSGYIPRSAAALADDGGPGENEAIAAALLPDERFGIVVFKRDAGEIPHAATYELFLGEAASTDAPLLEAAPSRTALRLIAPNPFAPRTSVHFDVARAGRVRIDVHDAAGRLVCTLLERDVPAGRHAVAWDGRDRSARPVASGIYFVKLRTPDAEEVRKVTRLR